jgi:hypothetical protein
MGSFHIDRFRSAERGFALVVTLSLMILLTIIAVGLLTLSAVSLRSSTQGEAAAVARANARMALMMAIGELQREMGPDSRVSAPPDAGKETSGGHPRWTAVYDAWKWNQAPDGPETPQSRKPAFRGWLVSGGNQASGGPVGTADKVLLLGAKSLGGEATADDEIRVPMHEVNMGGRRGRIAWWTADESAKAKINAGPESAGGALAASSPLLDAQAPPNIGHRAIPKLENHAWKTGQRAMTTTTASVNLAAELGAGGLGSASHDVTVHSAGVLADVRSGRLRRDLSQLLARLAQELEDKPLYLSDGRMNRFRISRDGAVSNTSMVQPWNTVANTSSEWGINLEELHLFHSLHRELAWSGGSPRLLVKGTRDDVVKDRYYMYSRPMVDAVQFILSLKAFPSGTGGNYRMEMMLDGMVALSNPNDVPIQWPAGLILPVQLQNVPYNITWEIKDVLGATKSTKTADSPNFGLFVGRIGGGVSTAAAGFTLGPGESATFGSTTASGANLDLRPGFVPSGGVRMTGWNLNADQLKTTDMIDFRILKDSNPGFSGNYTYYNVWIGDRKSGTNAKGWQSDTASLGSGGDLNSTLMNELLPTPIRPPQVRPVSDFINKPQPVMMMSFLRNVERPSGAVPADAFVSRPFQLNEPGASGRGLTPATIETARHATQQLITAEAMNYQFRTLAAGAGGRNVYHGGGRQPNLGGGFSVIKRRIPIAPPMSLGSFENAIASGFCGRFSNSGPAIAGDPFPADAIALSGHKYGWPLTAKAIGNSWSTPFVGADRVHRASTGGQPAQKAAADHSWMANTALWDSWFLSGIVDGTGAGASQWSKDSRSPRSQFLDLAKGEGRLRNKRFLFHPYKPADEAVNELFESGSGNFKPSALNQLPNYLLVDGAFNVNSTSVKAWAAFLDSVRDQEVLTAAGGNRRFDHPFGTLGYAVNTATSGTDGDWAGLRSLSTSEIDQLASAIVTEVRARGPFLSVADFVNRRPNSKNPAHRSLGALQAAIDSSGLNNRYKGGARGVNAGSFEPLEGGDGVSGEPVAARSIGSAGYLSQAALLTAIGSQITVRGDTFIIRAYGDARDSSGKIMAKAWCEATVQRNPEYLNPADAPEAQDGWPRASDQLAAANSFFGRRMALQSFRWLNSDEI